MIDKDKLRVKIETVLKQIDMYSEDAVNLLMGTAAQESHFKYVRQIGGGPALGYFQMEPATFIDICNNWLKYKNELWAKIYEVCNVKRFDADDLAWNVELMICFARLHYMRRPEKMPDSVVGYANYWKNFYNTHLGAGTVEEFLHNYKRFGL